MNRLPTGKLKIGNPPKGWHNKPNFAFWTSSYNENIQASDWVDFVKGTDFTIKNAKYAIVFKVQGAKIYTIKTSTDFERLLKEFPFTKTQINWKKLSKKYDAVHVANPKAHEGLLGWDVESTVWFNMRPLKVVGTIKV